MAEDNSTISVSGRSVAVACAALLFAEIMISFTAADILRLLYKIGVPDYDTPAFIRIVRDAIRQHTILTVVHLFTLLGFILPFTFAGFQKGGLSKVRTLLSHGGWWIPALCIGYAIIRLTIDYLVVTLASVAPATFTIWLTYVNIAAAVIGIGICSLCFKAMHPNCNSTKFYPLSLAGMLMIVAGTVAAIIFYQGPTRQIIAINRAAQSTFASARVTAMDRDLELLLISGYLKSGRYFSADFYRSDYPDRQTTDSINAARSPIGITANWHNDRESSKSTYRLETNRLRSLDNAFTLSVDVDNPLNESQKAAVESEANNVASQFLTQVLQSLSD